MDDVQTESNPDVGSGQDPEAPGWYPDPANPDALRHWDGSTWSESLFDDITSVAVVESRDPGLFLDDVDPPARVALPGREPARSSPQSPSPPPPPPPPEMVEEPAEAPNAVSADVEPAAPTDTDLSGAATAPLLLDEEPRDTWETPKRSPVVRVVLVAACVVALAAIGVLVWQLLASDDEGASDAVVADEASDTDESAEPAAEVEGAGSATESENEPEAAEPESDVAGEPSAADEPAAETPAADERAEEAVEGEPTEESPAGGPLLAGMTATLVVDSATVRAEPRLESADLGLLELSVRPEVTVVGAPVDGWRAVEGTGGWVWGAFLSPAPDQHLIARTIDGSPAVLRDEAGVPTGTPSLAGANILIVDGSQPLWQVILPEGGFAYVDGAEFELILP